MDNLQSNIISAEEKKELVKKLLQQKINNKKEIYPLSHGQKALWFLNQNNPDSTAYNVAIACKISSTVDVQVLKSVLQRLINRHAIFRTTYSVENENPIQCIHAFKELSFTEINASKFTETELLAKLQESKNIIFDLTNGPVVRAYLLRKSMNESHLMLCAHHIAFDGWSSLIFLEELKLLYSIVKSGDRSLLPEIKYTYANYTIKQQELLDAAELEGNKQWKYWENELSGELPVLNLQTDFPRPAIQTENGASFKIELEDETVRHLKEFSKAQGVTTFMILLGVFKILLHRYTQQDDIIIGTPTAGRSRPECLNLMGHFINPVVIRSKFNNNLDVLSFLKETRTKVMNALSNHDYPFSLLVDKLKLKRDPSRTPIFQTLFGLQKYEPQFDMNQMLGMKSEKKFEDHNTLHIEPYDIIQMEGQVDLAVEFHEIKNKLSGYFKYNTDLFRGSSILQMVSHYEKLLKNILENPNQKISTISILTELEEQQLVVDFNNTSIEFPESKCIHELIEAQVLKSPEKIALVFEDKELSYQEMDNLSNQLAHYIIKCGVNPGDHVGISVDRSLNMVVGMLGIVKAGAAYVPLDPTLPNERLLFIVNDSKIKLILTQECYEYKFPDALKKLSFDLQFSEIKKESTEKPAIDYNSENLAYIIYTSGSTGQPKGVMVEHKQVVNFFIGMNKQLENDTDGCWLALTTFSFDISVQELLWPLTKGFKVVIQDNDLNQIINSKLPSPLGVSVPIFREGQDEGLINSKLLSSLSKRKGEVLDFSLFYFSSSDDNNATNKQENKYKLLLEGAKFADQNGFSAVWTPERHFHEFGGLYPNPSVTGAAIAAITKNIQIRSGSIVAPLHNPIRIAEEWSVVDNISNGRVGLSFASGWQINDFVLNPENYKNRNEIMYNTIDTVQNLWKGNSIGIENSNGNKIETKIFPKPIQQNIPLWITAAGNPETYKRAGEMGANLLTHLLGQTIEELAEKIKIYKTNWQYKNEANQKPHVTLMLHTFIGKDIESVKKKVYKPFCNYLSSSLDLIKNLGKELGHDVNSKDFNQEDHQALLSFAFDRYFQTASLFGTPHSCQDLLDKLLEMGVNEVACLIDFGVENETVIDSFYLLNQTKKIHSSKQNKRIGEYALAAQIKKHEVTHMQCTPSMIRMLSSDSKSMNALNSLKKLLVGGEALSQSVVNTIFQNTNAEILNMYGPTETTIWSSCAKINKEDESITIGKPIANTQIYILDKNMQLTPIGVPGEIYIGGSGVARGYIGKDELTSEKFIKNPFKPQDKERLYKTGDLGRYLPNGNIEYIGRADSQIKIRGHRIELGEIETKLNCLKEIKECAVIAKKENEEYKLLAFVVMKNIEPNSTNELRKYLQESLPFYMVPSSFIFLNELPLTSNKKVDIKYLQQYHIQNENEKYAAPQNAIEKKLAKIWEDVLGIKNVGIHDNFFDLGGDSILGIQILSRANQEGIKFLPKQLFQYQTIAALATVAKESTKIYAEQGIITGILPLSPIQQWFFEQDQVNKHHYNQAILIEVPIDINEDFIRKATKKLLEQHDALRLSFTYENGKWKQEYKLVTENVPVFVEDLSNQTPENQLKSIEDLSSLHQANLNLTNGNIIRIVLFKCGQENTNRLLFIIHHLAVDGISWRILLQDFNTLYNQLLNKTELNLPAKTTSFKEWSTKLIDYSKSEKINSRYWLNQAEKKVKAIPTDFIVDGIKNTVESTEKIELELDQKSTQQLLQDIATVYNTQINDILLSALCFAYHKWSDNETLLLDIEGHGRESLFDDVDISSSIGWFTSLFPVLLDINPSPMGEDIGSIIKSTKETLRNIPANGLEYGVLRYLSSDQQVIEKLKSAPKAEIMFNYLGQTDQILGKTQGWNIAKESVGPYFSLKNTRTHLIEILGIVQDGKIKFSFLYSGNIHTNNNIQKFADYFKESLTEIISHCIYLNKYEYSPSDFPLTKLNQTEINTLIKKANEKNNILSEERITDVYPLAPMQSGLLFHSVNDEQSNQYLRQFSFSLNGKLNIENFKLAWEKVILRHPILRTIFNWDATKEPLQLVYPSVPLNWMYYDLTELPAKEKENKTEIIIQKDRTEKFDLSKASLLRFKFVKLENQHYKFIWSYHHILLDGWCLPVIFKEVFDIYNSIENQMPLNPQIIYPYRNYIEWLQLWDVEKAKKFWKNQFAEFTNPTIFNLAEKLNKAETTDYKVEEFRFSADITFQLEQLAKENRITINTIFQAAWAILLSKYSGEQDVAFGSIVSGRPPELDGVETMLGLFINNVPVRIKIDSSKSILHWLKELYENQIERDQYAYSSLSDIQKWSNTNGRPLFDSIIAFENYPIEAALNSQLKDIKLENIHFPEPTNYPITLFVIPGKKIIAKIGFDQNKFENNSIKKLLFHFSTIIKNITNNLNQSVSAISMIDEEEKNKLLSFNSSPSFFPHDKCIHQIFEEQLHSTPNKVALKFNGKDISFIELNKRANQLAHYLLKNGVEKESRVGIYLDRSVEMIVSVLGILKAGGTYVPIDTTDPKERIEFILSDTKVSLLITSSYFKENLSFFKNKLIVIDEDQEGINNEATGNLNLKVSSNDLAYIMYTSGSTGKPKGVCVEHKSIVRLVKNTNYFTVSENEVFLHFAPLAFDASTFEIWAPLLNQSTLVIALPGKISLEEIGNSIRLNKVTIVFITTSLFNLFVDENIDALSGLKQLLFGGEVSSIKHVNKFIDHHKSCKLSNIYGPTENTTYSCFFPINEKIALTEPLPIGKPISNTQVYILDQNLEPLPIGISGELYTGGAGVARCYLNQSDLTKEKFIKNPFDNNPASRLYKTGDMARYLPDGNIEFLGRNDNQIKISGHRIELEEIQHILNQHPNVKESIVLMDVNADAHKKIIAFVIFNKDLAPTLSKGEGVNYIELIVKYLKQIMAEYMIPSAIIELDVFPLLSNGKVDRKALAKKIVTEKKRLNTYADPTNVKEELLKKIWQDVLKVNQVGIHDNFFELGGDSILAIQIVSRINQQGYQLNTTLLFQCQTIAELAAIIKEQKNVQAQQSLVVGNVPLLPIQKWFFEQNLINPNHFNQAIMLEVPSTININYLAKTFEKVIEHHDVLRSKFINTNDVWSQEVLSVNFNFLIAEENLSEFSENEQKNKLKCIADKAHNDLSLQNGKLIKVVLFNLGNEQPARLLIIIHHLVIDGISWRILMEDLFLVYTQLSNEQKISLPLKTTSFKDWANKIVNYIPTNILQTEIDYWKKVVEHTTDSLPIDFTVLAQNNIEASSKQFSVCLNENITQLLLKQIPKAYNVQINDVLLTALSLTFNRWTGKNEIKIDLEGHGRENLFNDIDISRTIGWFTTKYPVVLSVNNNQSIDKNLISIHDQLKKNPANGMGYGLITYLQNSKLNKPGNAVQPEVVFNYLGQTDQVFNSNLEWKLATEPSGQWKNKNELRTHLIEINAIVVNGKLEIIWTYSDNFHSKETIEKLAYDYREALESIIENSRNFNSQNYELKEKDVIKIKSLVPFRTKGNKPPLFFIPGAGGNVMYFQKLAQYLGNDQPFYGMQAVGIDGIVEPLHSIEEIAKHYINEIIEIDAEGPYHIAGHSFGAWIAFEMAIQLKNRNKKVAFLGIVDMYAPQKTELRASSKWEDDAKWHVETVEMLRQLFNLKIELSYDEIKELTAEAQFIFVKNKLEQAQLLPENSDVSLLKGLLNVQKANSRLYYYPKEIYQGKISLIRANKEATGNTDFEFSKHFLNNESLDWNKFSNEETNVSIINGDHISIMKDPNVIHLAEKINYLNSTCKFINNEKYTY